MRTGDHVSTKDVHAEVPAAQNFHPEFGYFCPSVSLRRKVRGTVMTLLGMAIAAAAAVALVPHIGPPAAGDVGGAEPTLSGSASPPLDKAVGSIEGNLPATVAPTVRPSGPAVPLQAGASCDDLSASFLASRCQVRKAGKSRAARAARARGSRVAAIPIAGADLEAVPARDRAESGAAAIATVEAPPVQPVERPAKVAKKPVKTARTRVPNRDIAGAEMLPPAPAPAFGFFGFYQPPRSGSGAWAMSR